MNKTPESSKIVISEAELRQNSIVITDQDINSPKRIEIDQSDLYTPAEQRADLETKFAEAREKVRSDLGQTGLQDSVQLKRKES